MLNGQSWYRRASTPLRKLTSPQKKETCGESVLLYTTPRSTVIFKWSHLLGGIWVSGRLVEMHLPLFSTWPGKLAAKRPASVKAKRITSYTRSHGLLSLLGISPWPNLAQGDWPPSLSGTRFLHKPFLQPNMKSIDFLPLNAPLWLLFFARFSLGRRAQQDKKQLGSGYLKRAIMPPSSNFIKTPHRETTTDPPRSLLSAFTAPPPPRCMMEWKSRKSKGERRSNGPAPTASAAFTFHA